ncbi:MAG TPA: HAMP domain-containing sensor histidine kinase [Terriglobales bacterium]|jgi:signal transduction histidine kinase
MSARSKVWAWVLVCLVTAQIIASLSLRKPGFILAAFSDGIQCALLFCAALSCLPHVFKSTHRVRLFWILMGLGLTSWLIYQSLWTYIEVVQRRDVPDLFAGDAIIFLHFVPMMAALAFQPNVQQDDRELRLGSLDFALLLLWWIYVYVYSVMAWQYVYPDSAAYGRNLNFVYLIEKFAFLGALAVLWVRSSGRWRTIYAHWFGASLLYSLSSFAATWALYLSHGTYYSGSLYDLPLVASMAWMAVPGLLAMRLPKEQAVTQRPSERGLWTARLGMAAVFSLPIFAWISFFDGKVPLSVRGFRILLTLGAMLLMGGLVFLKQHLLDIELIQLLRGSRKSLKDLQLLQTQLVQSEKLASLGQLVGGAAHELNNPLTAMLGYSELLGTTELSSDQRALTAKISLQARRIRTLVASLLSFAKQAPAAKADLDINVVVQTAIKLCQPQIQSSHVRSSVGLEESLPRVHGDSNQLLQVFSHIINNAAHAMSDHGDGTLTVCTRTGAGMVIVEFSDDGPGMSDPVKVFDPFYTTRPVGQGTGLGLSMCYGIIEGHGGKISGRNRSEGGASFIIELPAAQSSSEKAHAHAAKL